MPLLGSTPGLLANRPRGPGNEILKANVFASHEAPVDWPLAPMLLAKDVKTPWVMGQGPETGEGLSVPRIIDVVKNLPKGEYLPGLGPFVDDMAERGWSVWAGATKQYDGVAFKPIFAVPPGKRQNSIPDDITMPSMLVQLGMPVNDPYPEQGLWCGYTPVHMDLLATANMSVVGQLGSGKLPRNRPQPIYDHFGYKVLKVWYCWDGSGSLPKPGGYSPAHPLTRPPDKVIYQREGETVIIPRWWWHSVETREP